MYFLFLQSDISKLYDGCRSLVTFAKTSTNISAVVDLANIAQRLAELTDTRKTSLTIINFLQHDEHFEGFCEALEANDQHGVLMRHGGVTVPLSIKYG